MRPLYWVELKVLVKTLLNHSFGHHFKQNINQSRSVWTKAQICLEDLQTSENTVQVLHITLKSKLARIWSSLKKFCTAPVRHLFQTFHLTLCHEKTWIHPFSSSAETKSLTVVFGIVCALTGGICRGAKFILPWLREENREICRVFQS